MFSTRVTRNAEESRNAAWLGALWLNEALRSWDLFLLASKSSKALIKKKGLHSSDHSSEKRTWSASL
jgi:hypothetical protein